MLKVYSIVTSTFKCEINIFFFDRSTNETTARKGLRKYACDRKYLFQFRGVELFRLFELLLESSEFAFEDGDLVALFVDSQLELSLRALSLGPLVRYLTSDKEVERGGEGEGGGGGGDKEEETGRK